MEYKISSEFLEAIRTSTSQPYYSALIKVQSKYNLYWISWKHSKFEIWIQRMTFQCYVQIRQGLLFPLLINWDQSSLLVIYMNWKMWNRGIHDSACQDRARIVNVSHYLFATWISTSNNRFIKWDINALSPKPTTIVYKSGLNKILGYLINIQTGKVILFENKHLDRSWFSFFWIESLQYLAIPHETRDHWLFVPEPNARTHRH